MSGRELTMIHDGFRALNLPEYSVPVTDADEEVCAHVRNPINELITVRSSTSIRHSLRSRHGINQV